MKISEGKYGKAWRNWGMLRGVLGNFSVWFLKIFDDFDDESLARKVQLIRSRLNKLTLNKICSEEKLTKAVGRYLWKSCSNSADIKSCSNWPVTAIFRFFVTVSIFDPSGTKDIAKSSFILIWGGQRQTKMNTMFCRFFRTPYFFCWRFVAFCRFFCRFFRCF